MQDNHIAILLPPDGRWLPFLGDGLAHYARTVGFSKVLENNIIYAVMETCEELIRISEESGILEPFKVLLDFSGEAAIIEIEYNGSIPLNPYATEEYEVPDADADLDSVVADGLWLFLLKKQMDRVFFRVRGKKRVLSMMQYRREEGMEKRLWAMSIRPKLREDLDFHLQQTDGAASRSVLQKDGGAVLLLGPSETFFVQNMNGVKTFHDLYMEHVDAIGLVSPNLLTALYENLESMDMLASTGDQSQESRWKKLLRKMINPSFSIPRADEVVTAVHRWTQVCFTPFGVALLLLLGATGVVPLWYTHQLIFKKVAGLDTLLFSSPQILIPLYVLTLIHVSLHELGHGVACKHFGGRVPRMGIMFYLASYIFFCDTTAAYNFPKKRQRVLVSLGGPVVSFAIFGLGLWATGYFAGSGSLWESVFVAFSLFNFFGLVMNFNPFIKMDAYYMLMDLTGIHNLRAKSFRFLNRKLLGWLGFGSEEDVQFPSKEKRIFWWYGLLGGLFTLIFIIAPLLRLIHLAETQSLYDSRVVFALVACTLLLIRMGNLAFERLRGAFYREYKLK